MTDCFASPESPACNRNCFPFLQCFTYEAEENIEIEIEGLVSHLIQVEIRMPAEFHDFVESRENLMLFMESAEESCFGRRYSKQLLTWDRESGVLTAHLHAMLAGPYRIYIQDFLV